LRVTSGDGSASLFLNPRGGAPLASADTSKDVPSASATVQMQAGKPFYLRVEYTKSKPNGGDALCRLEWQLPTDDEKRAAALERLTARARTADAVLVFAGIDYSLDSEGRDRNNMHFPEAQQTLIRALAKSNPRTIVTLINGSPLELGGWLDDVPAVLEAWYPGMESGTAIAGALFGRINPSGHLSFTWPKRLADSPAHAVGTETQDRVDYKEGVLVGYRYFDTKNIAPQFPFGFGLSYTTFKFENLALTETNGEVTACVTVQNTGTRAGAETVQLYVQELHPPIERPVHELKAFQKIELAPGETKTVAFKLDRSAFSYYSPEHHQWELPSDDFEIQIGDSSRNLPLTGQIKVGGNLSDTK
jgi:beta-glucosidase